MQANTGPELWAGIECTINRVGDNYHQQLDRNGHATRLSDLDAFASLGIKTIRYPILWEQIAPGKPEDADWNWADERLERLRTLGIRPIAGFVHHGSGPMHTSLADPEFPAKLAGYAAAFAERYPWVEYYTPVNEPLTTARFSGLYGHWYPHGRDSKTFATTLIHQCKAVILSMQAIRKRIPGAKLVQTEDLGKVYGSPLLAYQADFENERRWLSLDLLCGKVKKGHPMWDELIAWNVAPETLMWFVDNACPPDIIGINHYVTSNRFLDEDYHQYPTHCHGGNGRHKYADVEAMRVPFVQAASLHALLKEVWNRYNLPIAVTEVHLGGHREEQLRWLKECWDTARLLYKQNVDIRAITVWSMLGSFDWNSLVTRNDHIYESGVFDIRGNVLRPTALSTMISSLISGKRYEHPVLNMPGFWKREDRFFRHYQRAAELVMADDDTAFPAADQTPDLIPPNTSPLLIIGSGNALAESFTIHCRSRAIHCISISRKDVRLTDVLSVNNLLEQFNPWALIITPEYEEDPAYFKEHINEHIHLAYLCQLRDIQLLTFSSAHVFNGNTKPPYVESDKVCPVNLNEYSQAVIEKKVSEIMPKALLIRTSHLFGPADNWDAVMQSIQQMNASDDIHFSFTYIPDLVNVCIDLLIDKDHGIRHLTNDGVLTMPDIAASSALHPKSKVLSSEKGMLLPSLHDALTRYHMDRDAVYQ